MSRVQRSLGLLAMAVLVGVAVAGGIELDPIKTLLPSAIVRWLIRSAATALVAVPALVSFARADQREMRAELDRKFNDSTKKLERMLLAAIHAFFEDEDSSTIRANVMIVSDEKLRMLASVNMDFDDDYGVTLAKNQGCAGLAWARAVELPMNECWIPVYAPRTKLTKRNLKALWNLTDSQVEATKHILWIWSIPLFYRNEPEHRFLGVLNFDGVRRPLRSPGKVEDHIGDFVALAERIARVIVEECPKEIVIIDNLNMT
jgi:hypothetical protein